MEAKNFFIDFLNYVFLLGVISIFLIYFLIGDRFELFTRILKSLMPLALFSVFFIFFYKRKKRQKKEIKDNDEVAIYLSRIEKLKDLLVIFLLAVINLLVPVHLNCFLVYDLVQVLSVFFAMIIWNIFLFRSFVQGNYYVITSRQIINDELCIFLFPIIFYCLIYLFGKIPDLMDVFQSLIVFVGFYSWHYLLFKKAKE